MDVVLVSVGKSHSTNNNSKCLLRVSFRGETHRANTPPTASTSPFFPLTMKKILLPPLANEKDKIEENDNAKGTNQQNVPRKEVYDVRI